jgi:hypothetical protein
VADSMLESSASVMVREESMIVAPSPSEKAREAEAPEMTGASLSAVTVKLKEELEGEGFFEISFFCSHYS